MRTGKCPKCKEIKEITEAGVINGMCDDCYKSKYTCVICGEMLTDPWTLWHEEGIGNGHNKCFHPDSDSTESAKQSEAEQ